MKQQSEIPGVVLVRLLRRLAEKRRRKYDPTRLYQGTVGLKRDKSVCWQFWQTSIGREPMVSK